MSATLCIEPDCYRAAKCKKLCDMHYRKRRRAGVEMPKAYCENCGQELAQAMNARFCSENAECRKVAANDYARRAYVNDPAGSRARARASHAKNRRFRPCSNGCGELVTQQSRTGICKSCQFEINRVINPKQRGLRQEESLAGATRKGYVWTSSELELVAREDLDPGEIASMIGRTMWSVRAQRALLRNDPRKRSMAGLDDRWSLAE